MDSASVQCRLPSHNMSCPVSPRPLQGHSQSPDSPCTSVPRESCCTAPPAAAQDHAGSPELLPAPPRGTPETQGEILPSCTFGGCCTRGPSQMHVLLPQDRENFPQVPGLDGCFCSQTSASWQDPFLSYTASHSTAFPLKTSAARLESNALSTSF